MDIAIIGYGKMGREIEKILKKRNHNITAVIDSTEELNNIKPSNAVCIDFTSPDAFINNTVEIAAKFSGCVAGTTGWYDKFDNVKKIFDNKKKNLVYGTNFSVGVNIFFEITDYAAKMISKAGGYDSHIIELHHKEKKDSPSGTALTLKDIISKSFDKSPDISSVRSGFIKGTHEIGFESEVDKITLEHSAYSREGFALGSVLAAEWIKDAKGVINFRELFKHKIIL